MKCCKKPKGKESYEVPLLTNIKNDFTRFNFFHNFYKQRK